MANPIAIVITGPVGVGKTTISKAISDIYKGQNIKHAVIDLDNLRAVSPWSSDDPYYMKLGFKNLASIWSNFEQVGIDYVVIPSVIETTEEKEQIQKAITNSKVVLVRLRGTTDTIHNQIRDRENTEESLKWHLNRAIELSSRFEKAKIDDFVVDIDDKTPKEIAEELLAKVNTKF